MALINKPNYSLQTSLKIDDIIDQNEYSIKYFETHS